MMTLQKDKWKRNSLGKVCNISSGGTPSKSIASYWINGTIPWLRSECCKDKYVYKVEEYISEDGFKNSSAKISKPKTTLIALVGATIGKTAFVPFEATTNQNVANLCSTDETSLLPEFLFYACQSLYKNYFGGFSGFKMANLSFIKNLEIPLPPLDEQQRIADLFQSLDQSLARAEEQEGHLKALRKALSNGLASVPPVFGNVLSAQNSQLRSFGEMCECIEQHDKTPMENGLTRFVGLEHIEPENFMLQGCGKIADGTTFTKRFAKGDVLFGKRRAYLKKVAVAEYDGICSSDILVFRAKQDRLLPELLPYYVSSEAFIAHAVSTSAGSLSPRTKWRDLAGVELCIPDMQAQTQIADVLQHLETTVTYLKTQTHTLNTLKQKLLNEILG